jgi:dihydroorotate dehydrogenase (NAD+) catalytic subunit
MGEMADAMGRRTEIDAIEVNLSCPNADGAAIAADLDAVKNVITAAVRASRVPILAKLPGDSAPGLAAAGVALDAGASGLTLINAVRGLRIDRSTGRAFLHRGIGGLCGPAIFPIALARVFEARRAFPGATIVGTGGVVDVGGAVEMLLAGADLVGIGFGFMVDPRMPARVADELGEWMARRGVKSIDELIGAAHHGGIDVHRETRTVHR